MNGCMKKEVHVLLTLSVSDEVCCSFFFSSGLDTSYKMEVHVGTFELVSMSYNSIHLTVFYIGKSFAYIFIYQVYW